MKRRGFLKALAGIPFLGALLTREPKPQPPKMTFDTDDGPTYDHVDTYMGIRRGGYGVSPELVMWNVEEKT